jgi:hypothetical protein
MPQVKKSKSKAGRRGNNEGSIYQRGNGTWCGQAVTGYKSDGTPVRKTVYKKTRNFLISQGRLTHSTPSYTTSLTL